jgi:hypothetical protein
VVEAYQPAGMTSEIVEIYRPSIVVLTVHTQLLLSKSGPPYRARLDALSSKMVCHD